MLSTIVAVSVLLLACGLFASYIPARRASRIDPMKALGGSKAAVSN